MAGSHPLTFRVTSHTVSGDDTVAVGLTQVVATDDADGRFAAGSLGGVPQASLTLYQNVDDVTDFPIGAVLEVSFKVVKKGGSK